VHTLNCSRMKNGPNVNVPHDEAAAALDVAAVTAPMQALHDSGVNYTYAWRRTQLLALHRLLMNHWTEWAAALHADLGKSRVEAVAMEMRMVQADLDYTRSHLRQWMQPQAIASPAICLPAFTHHTFRPRIGPAVLIIGPSNYPVSLVLHPVVGALAAGNPVVLKPSELTPSVEALFARLVPQYFDRTAVVCVTGGIPETTLLLQHAWGHIFFTGSALVGKIVATAAAATLTPVTLELGGKAPCYIDKDTCPTPWDVSLMCHRILWSKTVNAGQSCAATDTLVVHESQLATLIPALLSSLKTMFGDHPKNSDFGRLVSEKHAQRLIDMLVEIEQSLDDKVTKILCGGSSQCDVAARYVAPTLIINPPWTSRLLREEIFGPILPIVTVKSRSEAIRVLRRLPGTPLSLYVFTNSKTVLEEIVQKVPSGSVIRNDCLVHLSNHYMSFGGLGSSGYGAYHGRHSFELFSHKQPIMFRPCFPGFDFNRLRYHPFGRIKAFLVCDVAIVLPSIPVLRTRWLVAGLAVWVGTAVLGRICNVFALHHVHPWLVRLVLEPLVVALERIALHLRTSLLPH
jgi:acyl-CoA reductase-like NAD-dependent aldehyde dehydrogenase